MNIAGYRLPLFSSLILWAIALGDRRAHRGRAASCRR